MKCPHCGHNKSRVTDTEARDDADLRYRLCLGCARKFTTLERVSVFAGRQLGHVEVSGSATPAPPAAQTEPLLQDEARKSPRRSKPPRYVPAADDPEFAGICGQAQPLLLQWWNESRWSKHGGKATWTEAAWSMSMDRVRNLPSPHLQIALAQAGVENGWQALKPSYLDGTSVAPVQSPLVAGPPAPRDPAMLAALESWPA